MVFHSTFIGDCFAQFKVFIYNMLDLVIYSTCTSDAWKPEDGGGGAPLGNWNFKNHLRLEPEPLVFFFLG